MLSEIRVKGLAKCLAAPSVATDKLRFHITEVEPNNRSHAAHTHEGVEMFYGLEGQATVEVEEEHYALGPNEAIMIDASRPHGIFNNSSARVRYMVIIAK